MRNPYACLLCVGVTLAANSAWPCETKRPSRPGSADIVSEKVLYDFRTGDIELLFELKGKSEPFAVLWPLEALQTPQVSATRGDIFSDLEERAAPRLLSKRCDSGAPLGQSHITKTPAAGLASIESAIIESDEDLNKWFQAAGFEEPSDLSSLKQGAERFFALRVEPETGATTAAVRLDFAEGTTFSAWPKLSTFGAQGTFELTWYVAAAGPVSLENIQELSLDREALARAGLSRNTFEASYLAAKQRATKNQSALVRDAAVLLDDGATLSRFHGWLYLDRLSQDITLRESSAPLLPAAISYCADSHSLAPIIHAPTDDVTPQATEDVPPGGGGCATTPGSSLGSLFLLLGFAAVLRSRRAWLGLLALLGVACASPFNANTDNPPACTPRTFCDGAGLLHTVTCEGTTPKEVTSSCGELSCNTSTGACESCQPGALSCDSDQLTRCSADGASQSLVQRCEFGCADTAEACNEFRASHVPTAIQETAGVVDVRLQSSNGQPTTFFINADTGEIKQDNIVSGAVIRAAGAGVISGIAFAVVSQAQPPNSPSLGVFVVKSLRVDEGVTLRAFSNDRPALGKASNALVLVSQTDVTIAGVIDVSAGEFTLKQLQDLAGGVNPSAFSKLRNPGPGGYAGGETGVNGDGPGAGSSPGTFGLNAGGNGGLGFMAGAGGASFGGTGGIGGKSIRNVSGGVSGPSYGDEGLSVLVGGSGGGGGANDPHFVNPVQGGAQDNPATRNGGEGGGGGGALQITALGPNGITLLEEAGINAGGAGGRHLSNGFCCHPGAGGGGAGGAIFLEAKKVLLSPSAFLTANGGGGSGSDLAPSDACCDGLGGLTNSSNAGGGEGNGNGGEGGAGVDVNGKPGETSRTSTLANLSFNAGSRGSGSGGGGGVGRIRINTFNEQTFEATGAVLSPSGTFFSRGFLPLR